MTRKSWGYPVVMRWTQGTHSLCGWCTTTQWGQSPPSINFKSETSETTAVFSVFFFGFSEVSERRESFGSSRRGDEFRGINTAFWL